MKEVAGRLFGYYRDVWSFGGLTSSCCNMGFIQKVLFEVWNEL